MNILITGINGFVGSNLVKDWSANHTLFGLDINQKPKVGVKKIFGWGELIEIPPVDAIIHLAGKAHETKNVSLTQEYLEINTGLTQKIFDFFLKSDAKKFIFFSSVKAAADTVEGVILTEEIVPKPVGPYGISKIKAEEYILNKLSAISCQQSAKSVYILRPCMIHGPGNKGNLNLLYSVVSKGIPWPLGKFDNKRSFCSIGNIFYVVEQLIIREDVPSGIYQVGDDEPLGIIELIGLICAGLGKKPRIWNLPKSLINPLACIGGVLHLPLNKERLQKLTENYVVSNKKIKSALGIQNMPVTARYGMKRTLESFRR